MSVFFSFFISNCQDVIEITFSYVVSDINVSNVEWSSLKAEYCNIYSTSLSAARIQKNSDILFNALMKQFSCFFSWHLSCSQFADKVCNILFQLYASPLLLRFVNNRRFWLLACIGQQVTWNYFKHYLEALPFNPSNTGRIHCILFCGFDIWNLYTIIFALSFSVFFRLYHLLFIDVAAQSINHVARIRVDCRKLHLPLYSIHTASHSSLLFHASLSKLVENLT